MAGQDEINPDVRQQFQKDQELDDEEDQGPVIASNGPLFLLEEFG